MDTTSQERLGKYLIHEELGRGRFATVYRATDTALAKDVALKILHPALRADPLFVARFQNDARAAAQLEHPHIIAVYDFGELDGRLYIAMQFCAGGTLAERIAQKGRLPFAEAARVVGEIAEGLDYAHRRGFIHRDVKPSNILFNARDEAVLADFGLVKAADESIVARSSAGGVVGTPAYIAPEVWEGKPPGPETDVYGLGCVLAEMLTGEQLFKGDSSPAVMRAHFQPRHYPAQWPEGVPEDVQGVLDHALAGEISQRFASAGVFAAELHELEVRTRDPLAGLYRNLQDTVASGDWMTALSVAGEIMSRNAGYRDVRLLAERAAEGQARADRAAWAAQWRSETLLAEQSGQREAARVAAQRWIEMAPDDPEARAALARTTVPAAVGGAVAEESGGGLIQPRPAEPDEGAAPAKIAATETSHAEGTGATKHERGNAGAKPPIPIWAWPTLAVALVAVIALIIWKPWEPGPDKAAEISKAPSIVPGTVLSATPAPTAARTATQTPAPTPTLTPTVTHSPTLPPTDAPMPTPIETLRPRESELSMDKIQTILAASGTEAGVEVCTACHTRDGTTHQTYYDQLYQDGVIKVADVKYAFAANPDTTTITFNMTMNGQPFDPAKADNLSIYWAPYARGKFQFEPARDRLSLKGKISSDGKGSVISKLVELAKDNMAFVDYTDLSKVDGLIVIYGRDETQGTIPGTRVAQAKYPFAAIAPTGAGVNYVSPANVAGCVKCHTDPYLKHGYIYGQINRDPKTDFQTCKACHLDNGEGGHYEWQLLVNDPLLAARFLAEPDAEKALAMLTDAQKKEMAYKTTVMNDVHMSHAMEFPYPQSMSNCVTCHEGKLDKILTDANFTVATCKSCHPVTGAKAEAKEGEDPAWDTTGLALKTILPEATHGKLDLATTDCTLCHKEGGAAAAFNKIHTGYDKAIYTDAGIKYSDVVSTTITSAAFKDNKLTIQFKTAAKADFKDIDVTKAVTPTVLVGLYGWDTKDFLYGPHERTFDDNNDGKIDASDARNLEAAVGDKVANPRLTIKSTGAGEWEAVADLSTWAPQIADGSVKRVEIGVLTKAMAGEVQVAVDAATRTFELGGNAFNDRAFSPITQVEKCESCHAALATSFHNPAYGGSVTACRMCHITKAGGSHLEMQSRSIDSYAHAIHSGQAFDVGSIDFKDPVQALHYEEHITMPYPTHGTLDCESCHLPATYNPPTQDKSLPGLLSASSKNESWGRNIGAVPAMVVGPGQRACGSCHRAAAINEDKAGDLVMLNQHFEQGGYMIPAGDRPADTLMGVISEVMALFK